MALIAASTQPLVLSHCDLAAADLSRLDLRGVQITACRMAETSFFSGLLVGADMRQLSFCKMRLLQVDLSDADIAGFDFRDAVFEGGSLQDAHMKLARFDGAHLREMRLGGLKRLDAKLFKGATISHRQAAELVAEPGLNVA